jgi:Xaa-Pro aminopeptidase
MMHVPFDFASRRKYLDQEFSDAEYARRIDVVRANMAAAGVDALAIYCGAASYANARWLTNYQAFNGTTFVVIRSDGSVSVTTDGVLHGEPMHTMVWTCRTQDLRCAAGAIYGGPPDEVAVLAADALAGARRVGLVGGRAIPAFLEAALRSRVPELIAADAVVAEARMIKSAEEVARMEEAGRIADAAFVAVFEAMLPGVEETDVAAAAVATMLRMGAIESFRTCVVGGVLAGLKHSYPKRRKLVRGEMVFLDLGASYQHYVSDTSRTSVVGGRAIGDAADLLKVSEDLYRAGLEAMRPGNTVDDVAQRLIGVVRGTRWEVDFCPTGFGHGIGMDLFEAPGGLFAGSRVVLRPGMTLAYEPMVVVEGLGTGVVEDSLLITETGHRLLTDGPRAPRG